jgi:hypothetical protein
MKGNRNWEKSVTKSGRGKKGYYKGIYFMSTWELAFIVYNMDHGINFMRNWKSFDYIDISGDCRKYIPDFVLNDNTYVEVKGYLTSNDLVKINSFGGNNILFDKFKMSPILSYIYIKYGRNFYGTLKD